jgi:hypothetical protein
MTTNQKILIALGLGAVAFYVYKMRGNRGQGAVTQPQDNKGQNPPTSIEKPQVPLGNRSVTPPTMVADYSNTNRTISSNITQEERNAIQEAKNQSGKRYSSGDIIVTRLGNFKYVTIREGRRSGLSLGQPPLYDWVRTTEQPIVRTTVGGSLGALIK